MNYTLESFIDFCDTMEISNEGVIDKIIDIGYRYEEWKYPMKESLIK